MKGSDDSSPHDSHNLPTDVHPCCTKTVQTHVDRLMKDNIRDITRPLEKTEDTDWGVNTWRPTLLQASRTDSVTLNLSVCIPSLQAFIRETKCTYRCSVPLMYVYVENR
ncbi:hypothetical protein F2P81_008037 [Scophthalmus maximus]|uniref:Uncharacterized protein n=1 Tax=Scophthalmus maximus TaxID=52904 RepID=A0A6A4TCA5_SCOMX|nr:hypothetical protein F2P81_008037 [Scophthalmus maximus]